ncbi:MAG TPA: MlaD family protein [Solirubrobacteraceae bacterium]|jgi:virulence factor Mce-like protein|nr:MlaD family protein [Solirubrobacteraceae bacterium]
MPDTGIWARFDPVVGKQRRHPIRNGVILLAIIAYVLYSGYTRHLLFLPRGGTVVTADFANAKDLRNGTQVRVGGVAVGAVSGIHQASNGRSAIVQMRINDIGALNLRQDATANIYWRTLLGFNMYIQLNTGSPSAPPLSSRYIALSHTGTQVELDTLLQSLTPPARQGIRTFFGGFAKGFSDAAPVGQTVHLLGPTMSNVAPGIGALQGQHPGDLTTLVQQTNRLTGVLARNDDNLAGLIDSGATAFGVTAARSADLGSTVDQAPSTESQIQATMTRLVTTLNKLDPLAQQLLPGVSALAPAARAAEPTLREAVPVLNTARPTFRALKPALSDLQSAATIGTPLLQGYQPTVSRFQTQIISELADPDSDLKLPLYELLGPTLSSLGSIPAQYDAYGHIVYFEAGGGTHAISSLPCQLAVGTTDPSSDNGIFSCQNLENLTASLFGGGLPTDKSKSSTKSGGALPDLLSVADSGVGSAATSVTSALSGSSSSSSSGGSTSTQGVGQGIGQVVGLVQQLVSGVNG